MLNIKTRKNDNVRHKVMVKNTCFSEWGMLVVMSRLIKQPREPVNDSVMAQAIKLYLVEGNIGVRKDIRNLGLIARMRKN
jgi:hypothetical protein